MSRKLPPLRTQRADDSQPKSPEQPDFIRRPAQRSPAAKRLLKTLDRLRCRGNLSGEDGLRRTAPPYMAPVEVGDYAAAIPLLRSAVAQQDATAMGILGFLTARGYGVEQNYAEAALWLRQAAVRGHVPSQAALGMCLALGLGMPTNKPEGAHWLFQAAEHAHPKVLDALVALVIRDRSVGRRHFRDETLAELARRHAEHGQTCAKFAWAMCLIHGIGTEADLPLGCYWLYQAGLAGHDDAVLALASLTDRHPTLVGAHFTGEALARMHCQILKRQSVAAIKSARARRTSS